MKAVLDHVGIAVKDLPAALAFYRDALGLEVEAPEEVASQRVRAHFLPVGGSSLELLEATAADSPIAKYVEKRGPGLHHITLRVEDVRGAVERLKARGVRMIDETPRPGAEGSTIAFVHPSGTHGVLVELKQAAAAAAQHAPVATDCRVQRFTVGDLELVSVNDGFIGLDGGSMFGVVPKTLWSRKEPPDSRNRITLAMRALVVRGTRTMLVDAGLGDKENDKFNDIYGVDRRRNLDHTLAEAGLSPEDIDVVLATHLHFDHAGGFTTRDASGRVRPKFPRAQYIVRRGEFEDATHPHARNRGSYFADNYVPLAEAGVLQMVDDDVTIMPGVKVRRTGGHTMHHQMIAIESGGKTAAFPADLLPTTSHLGDAWIMGFDLHPVDTLTAKQRFLADASAMNTLVFFEHDRAVAAGYIREQNGTRFVEPATGASRTETIP
ncbi:MAG TPA: methylmalonyl-CoA epimerase [Vicinamibacterales bacterium]